MGAVFLLKLTNARVTFPALVGRFVVLFGCARGARYRMVFTNAKGMSRWLKITRMKNMIHMVICSKFGIKLCTQGNWGSPFILASAPFHWERLFFSPLWTRIESLQHPP